MASDALVEPVPLTASTQSLDKRLTQLAHSSSLKRHNNVQTNLSLPLGLAFEQGDIDCWGSGLP